MKVMALRAQGKAHSPGKADRLGKECNAALGAETRFHVSILSGCTTSGQHSNPGRGQPFGLHDPNHGGASQNTL